LCHASKLRAEAWAERAHQPLDVDILLSEEAIAKGYSDAMVLEADGKPYVGADAWMKLMTVAPWPLRWLSWFRLTRPTQWLTRVVYNVVAKYRTRWFGTRACQIPAR
jgi:predicted DCC family thiol-disulfide oxidoreductase YuxK